MKKMIDLKDLKLEGFAKHFHAFVMFITYPFRHFYKFLLIVLLIAAVIICVPLFNGVSFEKIPSWYMQTFSKTYPVLKVNPIKALPKQQKEKKPAKFEKQIKLKHGEPKKIEQQVITKEGHPVKEPEQKKYTPWKIKTKQQPEQKQQEQEIKEQEKIEAVEIIDIATPYIEPEVVSKEMIEMKVSDEPINIPQLSYVKKEDLPLNYLKTPQPVAGSVIIYGANELMVGDTYLYLYGIYTDPRAYDVNKVRSYLRTLIKGNLLQCYVVAYTYDNIATAICFNGDININQALVDAYMADNVAL